MTNRRPRSGNNTRRRSGPYSTGQVMPRSAIADQLLALHGWRDHEPHLGDKPVSIGGRHIWAAGTTYGAQMTGGRLPHFDAYVALDNVSVVGHNETVLAFPLTDFGGVPEGWLDLLMADIVPDMRNGYRLCVFCVGGHGRTGTVLASLIAILESEFDTPDPIQAIRERYCYRAVETLEQAEGIFALRGQQLPERWRKSLMPRQSMLPRY